MDREPILALLLARREEAVGAMRAQFGKRLMMTAMNILNDREDAEETVSDTYLAVWNTVPPKEPVPLAPFVYRVGRNLALKRLRQNTALKRDSRLELSLAELEACIPAPALEEEVDARELGRAIDRFLAALPKESRIIFLRRYWFGDSVREIAANLGLRENTVTVRLLRTREKLRTYLQKEGHIDE